MLLEDVLHQYYPVLGDGFISLQGVFGGDADIELFARVSYGKGTRTTSDTATLIRYLVAHDHGSPIEAVDLKFHVRCPISVMRQWIRHRMGSFCEYSARYSEVPELYYTPKDEQLTIQSTSNKQGRTEAQVENVESVGYDMWKNMKSAFVTYERLLRSGLARETARGVLPVNTYTEFYWKVNARSLMNFLSLRCDAHAQWEIRQYANVIARLFELACPLTYTAWEDYQFHGRRFSAMEMKLLDMLLSVEVEENGDVIVKGHEFGFTSETLGEAFGMTKREYKEFSTKFVPRSDIPMLDSKLFVSETVQAHLDG